MIAAVLVFVLRADVRPLCDQIAAVYRLDPAVRRILALALLHRMLSAQAPASVAASLNWRALGCLLGQCSIDLHAVADAQDRVDWFAGLARQAHDIADAVRAAMEARRPARGVGATQRLPRTWKPSGRVIDMATVTGGAR